MKPIIEVKNLSKSYKIRHESGAYITLRDVITDIFSNPFRFLKSKTKKVINGETEEIFWALKDLNFTINPGETLGIIGANGSGKSTLLKILSQITPPTEGEVTVRGKMTSLLEVGTGFHPELTGRENISLNGAILGMTKKEIAKKFDEIIAFAGVEQFLDTPVKHYSSGMYVRLAFAVAAHMEPDILVIDEVLAVGDAEFQKKCLGKIEQVTKEAGRTVLFVSHNMSAVRELCTKCILLKNGKIERIGKTADIIDYYLTVPNTDSKIDHRAFTGTLSPIINFEEILINNERTNKEVSPLEPISISLKGSSKEDVPSFQTALSLYQNDARICTLFDTEEPIDLKKGEFISHFTIPAKFLRPGMFSIAIGGQTDKINQSLYATNVETLRVGEFFSDYSDKNAVGIINPSYRGNRTQL